MNIRPKVPSSHINYFLTITAAISSAKESTSTVISGLLNKKKHIKIEIFNINEYYIKILKWNTLLTDTVIEDSWPKLVTHPHKAEDN
jgi:hypothetical protein